MRRLVVGCLAPLILLSFVFLSWLTTDTASTDVGEQTASPDGRYLASVERRTWSWHSSGFTDVVVYDRQTPGVLRWVAPAISGSQAGVFGFRGKSKDASVAWLGPRALLIEYRNCREILGMDEEWKDIRIEYKDTCQGWAPGEAPGYLRHLPTPPTN